MSKVTGEIPSQTVPLTLSSLIEMNDLQMFQELANAFGQAAYRAHDSKVREAFITCFEAIQRVIDEP